MELVNKHISSTIGLRDYQRLFPNKFVRVVETHIIAEFFHIDSMPMLHTSTQFKMRQYPHDMIQKHRESIWG